MINDTHSDRCWEMKYQTADNMASLAKKASPVNKSDKTESPVYENTKHQVPAVQWGGHRNSGDSRQQVAGELLKCHYHSSPAITPSHRHMQLDTDTLHPVMCKV